MSDSRARLAALYARSEYRVRLPAGGHARITPGAPLPAPLLALLPSPMAEWGLITAWNPRSQRLPVVRNRERQHDLMAMIRRDFPSARLHAGLGLGQVGEGARRWREGSLFITGIPLQGLCDLMNRFEQHAMLYGGDGSVARIVWTAPE